MSKTYFRKIQITREMRDHILAFPTAIVKEPQESVEQLISFGKNLINGEIHFYTQESRTVFFCQGFYVMQLLSDEQLKEFRIWSTHWYQFEYQSGNEAFSDEGLTGRDAWQQVMKELSKHYSKPEIEYIKKSNSWEPKENVTPPAPLHITPYTNYINSLNYGEEICEIIQEFDNCVYYDLNKAYAHSLMTMFPEIETWVRKGYERDKPKFKKIMNYTVGMMVRHESWKNVRYQIVKNISNRIGDVDLACDGNTIYINTDGIIISNPKHTIKTSNEIGDFKQEQLDNGKVWTYVHRGNPHTGDQGYQIMQYYENGKKVIKSLGGFRCEPELMDGIDLSKGIVARFRLKNVKGLRLLDTETIKFLSIEEDIDKLLDPFDFTNIEEA